MDGPSASSLDEVERLERALAAQEFLRGRIGDVVVDAAIRAIRARLDAIRSDTAAPAQRRFVTVLFADLAGFTAFADDKDPEVVASTMNELWTTIDAEIVRFGGQVDKHIGDAVMGVWGARSARESDAELAVRSALRIRQRFDEFSRRRGSDLALRIGISSGPAFFSPIGSSGEWSVTGDTVNIASRMEHAAPPGGILVSDQAWVLLRGQFVGAELPGFGVRGKPGVHVAHLVEGTRRVERAVGTTDDHPVMRGRQREYEILIDRFHKVVAGHNEYVLVAGEAGMGKSHLLQHFAAWLESRPTPPTMLSGRGNEWSEHVPLSLFRDLLWRHLTVSDRDAQHEVSERFRREFGPLPGAVIAKWLGIEGESDETEHLTGQGLGATAQVHLRRFLQRLSARGPVVVLVEDLHWADRSSVETLHELVRRTDGVMLIGTTRAPGGSVAIGGSSADLIMLDPLSDDDIIEVARAVRGPLGLTDAQAAAVADLAAGNPLHAEEVARSMVVDATPRHRTGSGATASHVRSVELSGNLAGVLQARLDSLTPSTRRALQLAAVIGREFSAGALRRLSHDAGGEQTDGGLEQSLAGLEDAEFVTKVGGEAVDDGVRYRFRHGLMRDAAYETVLLKDRPGLHRSVASWIRTRPDDQVTTRSGELAHHLSMAGDRRAASEVLAAAAAAADAVGAVSASVDLYERALDQRRPHVNDEDLVGLFLRSGAALQVVGEPTEAEAHLARAGEMAAELDLPALSWRAAVLRARALMDMGEWAEAEGCMAAIDAASPDLGAEFEVECRLARAALNESTGAPGSGLEAARDAADTAYAAGLDSLRCRALGEAAWSLFRLERYAEARECVDSALEIALRIGNIERQASLRMNLAVLSHSLAATDAGELDVAIDQYAVAADLFDELGSRSGLLRARGNLAQAEAESGRLTEARDRAAAVFCEGFGANLAVEWGLGLLVIAEVDLLGGDHETGLAKFGTLVADPRVERWDDQIDRILTIVGIDPDESWTTIRAEGHPTVEALLAEIEQPAE